MKLWAGLKIDLGYGPIEVPFKAVHTNGVVLLGGVFLRAHAAEMSWTKMELTLARPFCRVGVRGSRPKLIIPPHQPDLQAVIAFAEVQEEAHKLGKKVKWDENAQVEPHRPPLPEGVISLTEFAMSDTGSNTLILPTMVAETSEQDQKPADMISAWTVHARTLRPGEDTFLAVRLERALEPNQVFWPVKTRVEGLLDPKDGASSYDEADPRSVIIHLVNTTDKDVVLRPDDLVCYGSILDDAEDFRVHSSDDQGNASLLEQAQEVQPEVLAHEDEPEEEGWEETKTSEEPPPEPEPPPALHEKENETQHGPSPMDHRPGNRSARGRTSSAWHLQRYDTLVGQFDKMGSVPFVKRLVVYLFSGIGMGSAGAKLCNAPSITQRSLSIGS